MKEEVRVAEVAELIRHVSLQAIPLKESANFTGSGTAMRNKPCFQFPLLSNSVRELVPASENVAGLTSQPSHT